MKKATVTWADGKVLSFGTSSVTSESVQYRMDLKPGTVLLVPMIGVRTVLVETEGE